MLPAEFNCRLFAAVATTESDFRRCHVRSMALLARKPKRVYQPGSNSVQILCPAGCGCLLSDLSGTGQWPQWGTLTRSRCSPSPTSPQAPPRTEGLIKGVLEVK